MTAGPLPSGLDAWLDMLAARHAQTIQLGLERVRAVLEKLSLSSEAVIITVGGTNGKGSVCAMLEAILLAGGYSVGCYTSPHLLRYNERIRISGEPVDDQTLLSAFNAVESARADTPLTYFEHGTLAAWQIFCERRVEVMILEVGLGGRLDAVNAFASDCAIVTGVAVDHQDYLGDDREQIGFEKAGIFRSGCPAICGDPQPPASLVEYAGSIGAELWISGRDFGFGGDRQQWGYWRYRQPPATEELLRRGGLAYPALRGANQLLNAATALTALETLRERLPLSMQAIRQGLMQVRLAGRFQILPGRPCVILDVAHNRQAAGVLAENLSNMGFYPRTWAICGMLSDKDVEGVASLLRDRVDHWLTVSLPGPRGLDSETLAKRLRAGGVNTPLNCFVDVVEAFKFAQENGEESDRIIIFGSFLTVADALAAIGPA